MRFSVLIAAFAGAVAAMPFDSAPDTLAPADAAAAAVVPRQTINPEWVSLVHEPDTQPVN